VTARGEAQEHHLPRRRIVHGAVAVAVTAGVILFLFWLGDFAPAFRSLLRGAQWVVLALGVYWLYHALRPRSHSERRHDDRRDHRRRTTDPPLRHCDTPTTEPRAPGDTEREGQRGA